ncbi:MAG TPA: hypothetical protein VFG55_01085 [Rhodanobacteraceae bacterium]|nr:hypothetical protein [Rhodanobacteraceae bacterium]
MVLKSVLAAASVFAIVGSVVPAVRADTLLMNQVQQEHRRDLPGRGLTMAQVERRYGAPVEKLPTRGGDTPKHPPINRWRYADYTVYFERNRVIHSVLDGALSGRGGSTH